MRAQTVLQSTWQRMRRPKTWGAALLFGLVWNGTRFAMGWPNPVLLELITPPVWVALFLILAPLPWQWTGDDEPVATSLRGALQALPWMAALTLAVLLALGATGAVPQPPGRGMGMMERRGMHHGGPGEGMVSPRWGDARWFQIHPRLWTLGVAHLCFGLLLGWILADRERAEIQERAAKRAANEAQARALQGQMNPHVLFNAISALTELVREDPKAAEVALVNLSDLLRALLEHGASLRGPLGDERRLVEKYMTLERIRLGRRLQECWDWQESFDALVIPPLMIQPLVENALKHGVSKAVGGGALEVKLGLTGGYLNVRVANTGPALDITEGQGLGLQNLRERLRLLGAPADAFRLYRDGDWTVAELKLKLEEKV